MKISKKFLSFLILQISTKKKKFRKVKIIFKKDYNLNDIKDLICDFKTFEKKNWEDFVIKNLKKSSYSINLDLIFYEKNVNITLNENSENVNFLIFYFF